MAEFFASVDFSLRRRGYHAHGNGVISSAAVTGGVTREDGTAAPVEVFLFIYRGVGLRCIDQTTSDANGAWQFTNLNPNKTYMVFARDPAGVLNAAVLDNLVPVVP